MATIRRLLTAVPCLLLAACASLSTTTPNTAPLEFGMTPRAASVALGVPLEPLSEPARRPTAGHPAAEIYIARLPAATPGLFGTVDGLVYLQFRRGKLTGFTRDWHIASRFAPPSLPLPR